MSEQKTLRDTFAAAALTGFVRKLRPGSVFDLTITARQAFELADAMLRERAVAAAHTPTLTDAEREAVLCWCCSGPGIQSFHDSKADAEEYREHSGIADQVEIFEVGRAFTLTDAEREALSNAALWLVALQSADDDAAGPGDPRAGECAATLRGLLARLGGGK